MKIRFLVVLATLAVTGVVAPSAMASAGATLGACPTGYTVATTLAAVQTSVAAGHNTCFKATGTVSGTLTLTSAPVSVNVWDDNATATLSGQIRVQTDHVHLQNWKIAQVGGGTGLTGDCVRFEVPTAGAHDDSITQSTISGCGRDVVRFAQTTATTTHGSVANLLVTSAGFNFCTCYAVDGVTGNDVSGIGNDFLDGWGLNQVDNNVWHNSTASFNSTLCPVEGCHNDFLQTWQTAGDPAVGAPLVNTRMQGNVIRDITGANSHGLAIDGAANSGIVVRGNAFKSVQSMPGGFLKDASGTQVYGNTFSGAGATDTLEFLGSASGTVSSNLFVNAHSSGTLLWTVGTGTVTHNYNWQFGSDKTVSGEANGGNLAANPLAADGYHTAVTTLRNIGDPAWTARTDFDLQTILSGRMDVGGDETG